MKVKRTRANATEINKTPPIVRYVWVVRYHNSTVTSCMTYQTLDRIKIDDVSRILILDVITAGVLTISRPQDISWEDMKTEWRENYFNPEWNIIEWVNSFQ